MALTNTVNTTVNVGIHPMALEFNPSNNNIYVVNQGSNSISVIETGPTNTVNTTVNVGNSPRALEFNPSNNNMYVVNINSGDISVIDRLGQRCCGNCECWKQPNGSRV